MVIFLGAAAILVWMLRLTPFGRNIYAIGGNRDAAVLVGISVARVEMFAYGLAGSVCRPGRDTLRESHSGFRTTRGW